MVFSRTEWVILTAIRDCPQTSQDIRKMTGLRDVGELWTMWGKGMVQPRWLYKFGPAKKRRLLWRISLKAAYWVNTT